MKTNPLVRLLFAGALSLFFAAIGFGQVTRTLTLQAPPMVRAGTYFTVSVSASTNATDGEQVGFLHWDYSPDNGSSWYPINYDYALGSSATRSFGITAGGSAGTIKVRAKADYRDGGAGDVDYDGARSIGAAAGAPRPARKYRSPCSPS